MSCRRTAVKDILLTSIYRSCSGKGKQREQKIQVIRASFIKNSECHSLYRLWNLLATAKQQRRTERLGVDGKKTALKVMPPISLCWSTTSEADGGAVAIEVELS